MFSGRRKQKLIDDVRQLRTTVNTDAERFHAKARELEERALSHNSFKGRLSDLESDLRAYSEAAGILQELYARREGLQKQMARLPQHAAMEVDDRLADFLATRLRPWEQLLARVGAQSYRVSDLHLDREDVGRVDASLTLLEGDLNALADLHSLIARLPGEMAEVTRRGDLEPLVDALVTQQEHQSAWRKQVVDLQRTLNEGAERDRPLDLDTIGERLDGLRQWTQALTPETLEGEALIEAKREHNKLRQESRRLDDEWSFFSEDQLMAKVGHLLVRCSGASRVFADAAQGERSRLIEAFQRRLDDLSYFLPSAAALGEPLAQWRQESDMPESAREHLEWRREYDRLQGQLEDRLRQSEDVLSRKFGEERARVKSELEQLRTPAPSTALSASLRDLERSATSDAMRQPNSLQEGLVTVLEVRRGLQHVEGQVRAERTRTQERVAELRQRELSLREHQARFRAQADRLQALYRHAGADEELEEESVVILDEEGAEQSLGSQLDALDPEVGSIDDLVEAIDRISDAVARAGDDLLRQVHAEQRQLDGFIERMREAMSRVETVDLQAGGGASADDLSQGLALLKRSCDTAQALLDDCQEFLASTAESVGDMLDAQELFDRALGSEDLAQVEELKHLQQAYAQLPDEASTVRRLAEHVAVIEKREQLEQRVAPERAMLRERLRRIRAQWLAFRRNKLTDYVSDGALRRVSDMIDGLEASRFPLDALPNHQVDEINRLLMGLQRHAERAVAERISQSIVILRRDGSATSQRLLDRVEACDEERPLESALREDVLRTAQALGSGGWRQ